jgi:hypothetical protein
MSMDIAAHAEGAALEGGVVAAVLQRDQLLKPRWSSSLSPGDHVLGHGRIGFDRADAVDAGHRGDDDHIVAFQQRPRGRVAHAVDLFVERDSFSI